jgi:hypothetical protein
MSDKIASFNWPGSEVLNASISAKQHQTLLYENEKVRVVDMLIAPGEKATMRICQWPATLYIISFSHFLRYNAEGEILMDSETLTTPATNGTVLWLEPMEPHVWENAGETDLHIVIVEIKTAPVFGAYTGL